MRSITCTVPNTFNRTVQLKKRTVCLRNRSVRPQPTAIQGSRMKLDIELDRDNGVPLTEQIVNGVTQWIGSRTAHAGTKLPSIRQFAADHRISRFPVIEAYDRLVSLGYLDSRHGSGFFVAERHRSLNGAPGASDPRRAEEEA